MARSTGQEGAGDRPAGGCRWLRSRWTRAGLVLLVLVIGLWCFRYPLLRAMGAFLVTEDPVMHADAVYVLGGAALDRGSEAARLQARGVSDRFIFTGESVPNDIAALGLTATEGECTRQVAISHGLPEVMAMALKRGTSTKEEADALLDQALRDGADTVMVVSNEFHLRRIGFVFKQRFAERGITVLLHGAPNPLFSAKDWWTCEEGLMMLNNEYVKLAYYHWKY